MYTRQLAKLAADGTPIRVGIIGAGKFGGGMIAQISLMTGMDVAAVADLNLANAREAFTASKIDDDALGVADSARQVDQVIDGGKCAITEDAMNVIQSELIDVVVDATGIPNVGARVAYESILNRKHIIMVNVEADVTIGPILRRMADAAGVVYTAVDGDQPGCTMNIVEWARTLGFEIVAAGRGTVMYDTDRTATPDSAAERFGFDSEMVERRAINLQMFNSFRDGTKAQVEMTALANMTGFPPDVRGMHEPSVNLADIPQQFARKEEGGLLSQHGVVELANSIATDGKTMLPNPIKMGVFVVVRTENKFIQEDMDFYQVHAGGNGANRLLYRPYHLVAVTAPMSIAKAVIDGMPTGASLPTPTADVITVAKRHLEEGETIDGGGGYTVNGFCEKATVARDENLLPLGLSAGVKLIKDVAQGEAITYDMVEIDPDSFVYKLRQMQDTTVWDGA